MNFNDFGPEVQQKLTRDKLKDITENIAKVGRKMKRIFDRTALREVANKWTQWTEDNKHAFSRPQTIVKNEFLILMQDLLKQFENTQCRCSIFHLNAMEQYVNFV